jgi:predicted transcriptional regulator
MEEALASWVEFQATGEHLTGAEVLEWLSTWGTAEETEMPACHC